MARDAQASLQQQQSLAEVRRTKSESIGLMMISIIVGHLPPSLLCFVF